MARRKVLTEMKEAPAMGAAETSNADVIDSDSDYSIKELDGQEEKAGPEDGRQRAYAFMVYADSAYPDWMERLDAEHIEALVSPLHDQDVNPDGSQKKPHWHVMLIFDGKKSVKQINGIRKRVIGPNYNRKFETIGTIRGYARYMLHLDNPEKAQYNREGIREFCGVDYDAIITLPGDDVKMLGDIMEYIRANGVEYYSDFMLMCKSNKPEWFTMLVTRKSYVVIEFIKSESVKRERAERDMLRGEILVDPKTGEVLGG